MKITYVFSLFPPLSLVHGRYPSPCGLSFRRTLHRSGRFRFCLVIEVFQFNRLVCDEVVLLRQDGVDGVLQDRRCRFLCIASSGACSGQCGAENGRYATHRLFRGTNVNVLDQIIRATVAGLEILGYLIY